MEMKYYNSSNNFSAPIPRERREPKPYIPPKPKDVIKEPEAIVEAHVQAAPEDCSNRKTEEKNKDKRGFLSNLSQDDMIILGIIFLLLMSACDDYILLLALGYLFISGNNHIRV